MMTRLRQRFARPGIGQMVISFLIAALGWTGGQALTQIDQDLRIMYTEYTLGAADIAHVSADVIRFRTTVIRSVEAQTKKDFERITASLPELRARIQHAIDRYAGASLRVSRSGRSEPQDIQAVRESLDAYFSAASKTINLLTQQWAAKTPQEAQQLRSQAEVHAADNAGPKLIQVSVALDRLLETVADVAKDMRDEGTKTIRQTSTFLVIGSLSLAVLNLLVRRRAPRTAGGESPKASAAVVQAPEKEAPSLALPL